MTDSVAARNGTAIGASISGGAVTLSGTDQYVDLPDGLVSSLTSTTIEAWVTWTNTTPIWQRIFDFGSNNGVAGAQGSMGQTYLFLTPRSGVTNRLRVTFTLAGTAGETIVEGSTALPSAAGTHVAVVVDGAAQTLSLYLNGASEGSTALAHPLASLSDTNNWLGRSQFMPDPEFGGSIQEFRIYSVARTTAQLAASFAAGPDALPTQ